MFLGNHNINLGYIEKGLEQLKESYRIGKDINASPVYLANVENNIARVYLFMLKYKEAEKFLVLAGNNLKRADQANGVIYARYLQSTALLERVFYNDIKKALKLFRRALKAIKTSNERIKEIIEASILYNMADSYMEIGNNEKAMELLFETLRIYKKIDPKHPKTMFTYYLLGRTYTNIRDYTTAMNYYKKSLSIARKTVAENHALIGQIYGGIGILYLVKKEYDIAEDYFQKAIDIEVYLHGENTLKNVVLFANLSLLNYLKKEYSKALEKSEFGLSLYKKNNYAPDTIYLDMLQTRLDTFQKLGRKKEAQKCAELIKKYSSKTHK